MCGRASPPACPAASHPASHPACCAGHERLLGLLGGGNGGTVEALTSALVGAIENNNDRRVGPICALAARTLTFSPSAALAAVRAARRAGVDAIVARLEHTVVDLTVHSCDILSELEDALRFEPSEILL